MSHNARKLPEDLALPRLDEEFLNGSDNKSSESQQNLEIWDHMNMEPIKFEKQDEFGIQALFMNNDVPTETVCPLLLPSGNHVLEEHASYLYDELKKQPEKLKAMKNLFSKNVENQSKTIGRRKHIHKQTKKTEKGIVRLKTWQEFNNLHEHAIKHGFQITDEEIAEKYKRYVKQGQALANVEKQYLSWLEEIEQFSLHLDSSRKDERLRARKQRIQDLFTKLRWHLTDRFIPEVLTQTVKRVSRGRRALPKQAVEILKKWLFEHFGNPYPNMIEKQHLAYRTGLTTQQVSYWFINARVRIWKPLVEKYQHPENQEHGNTSP